MNNRVIAKISRTNFKLLFCQVDVAKKRIVKAKTRDYNNCPIDCKNKNNPTICSINCPNYCLKDIDNETINSKTLIIEEYINDTVIHKDAKALSKSQILQYLFYHYLPLSSEGKFNYISEKDLAETLNITVKTIRRNNEVLQGLGLIEFKKEEIGYFNIKIINYEKAFDENGSGTVNIPYNFFEAIQKMNNIDCIKIALFMFEKHFSYLRDAKDASVTKDLLIKFIKKIIPKGKNYNKYILMIINSLDYLFTIESNVNEKKVRILKYRPKVEYLTFYVINKVNDKLIKKISEIFIKLKMNKYLTAKVYDDLIQLGFQYGVEPVLSAITLLSKPNSNKKFNIGAIVRTELEKFKDNY